MPIWSIILLYIFAHVVTALILDAINLNFNDEPLLPKGFHDLYLSTHLNKFGTCLVLTILTILFPIPYFVRFLCFICTVGG